MSRTVTGLSTHLSGTAHTRCYMLLIELRDGTVIGITDHDTDIDYNLTEAGAGTITYSCHAGITLSDVVQALGLDTDNYEITGPIGGAIDFGVLLLSGDMQSGTDVLLLAGDMTDGDDELIVSQDVRLSALLGGRYNRARCWLFQLNWDDTASGKIPILLGTVSELKIQGGKFILQNRSDKDRLNQIIGRLTSPYCDADFGDARCGVTPESIVGTVTAVTSPLQFTVSFAGSYADDYFNLGTVEALTGDLAGTLPVEIWDWTSAGVITLFTELTEAPVIGDTFTIKTGCSKLWISDDASVRTCVFYDNAVNFRGFPFMPGSDQALKVPVPGE